MPGTLDTEDVDVDTECLPSSCLFSSGGKKFSDGDKCYKENQTWEWECDYS